MFLIEQVNFATIILIKIVASESGIIIFVTALVRTKQFKVT